MERKGEEILNWERKEESESGKGKEKGCGWKGIGGRASYSKGKREKKVNYGKGKKRKIKDMK